MTFKIEIGVLNVTNYPIVARHFEEMASRGWLIHKVILESIFIYKKIQAEDLDFSISPYEVETTFTKKRKSDIKEFQSVCQSVGWNYASKSKDFHIYYKEKDSEATELETDDEAEFRTIEKIAKKQLMGMYFALFIIISVTFLIYFIWFDSVEFMRDSLTQLIAPLFPIFIILGIGEIINIKKFLKINKHNIEIGSDLEYKHSKFYLEKAMYILGLLLLLGSASHLLYVGIILKNYTVLKSILPFLLGTAIGMMYNLVVKPSRTDTGIKVIILVVVMIVTLITINVTNVFDLDNWLNKYNDIDIDSYRALTAKDFDDKETINIMDEGKLLQNASLLVPKSYDYRYYNNEDRYVITEYSNVLTEELAKMLVNRYIERAKSELEIYEWQLERSIEEGRPYNNILEENGLSLKEFNKLDKTSVRNAVRDGMEIMKEKAVSKDKDNLWNLDEVYFLDYEKTLIVVRKEKEVFYLTGKDFTDPEIIEIVKKGLGL